MASDPPTLFGAELQMRPLTSFANIRIRRVIATGCVVTVAHSTPDHKAAHQHFSHPTPVLAQEYALNQVAQLQSQGYAVMFSTQCDYDPDALSAAGLPRTLDEVFVDEWTASIHARLARSDTDPRGKWMTITGVFEASRYNHTAVAIADYLQAAPHWIDEPTDRIVGLVGALPLLARTPFDQAGIDAAGTPFDPSGIDAAGTGMAASLLGDRAPRCEHSAPACVACSTRIAELLGHWTANHPVSAESWTERSARVDAARRLVAAPILRAHDRITAPTAP